MTTNQELSTLPQWPANLVPEDVMKKLFLKMTHTYGVKFLDQWAGIPIADVRREWGLALAQISPGELASGWIKLNTRDWPPTLPEFMKLCRPSLDPLAAYHEALEQGERRLRGERESWSLPAIFWAWSTIGAHDFGQLGYAVLKPRWERVLAAELAKDSHEPIPVRAIALPAPGQTRTPDAQAREMLKGFGLLLAQDGAGAAAARRGPEWARRIMERSARGELMPLASMEAAEKVLGINRKEKACP